MLLKHKESDNLLGLLGRFIKGRRKVLDIGCGAGVLAAEIKNLYGCDVYGIDINKVAVERAIASGVKARKGDIEKRLPYENESFDMVLVIQVIEHVLDTDRLIIEARRVLKRDGFLIVSTPNLANWFNRIIFLFGFQPFFTEVSLDDKTFGLGFTRRMSRHRDTVGHIRVFTLRALKDFLGYHKFKLEFIAGGSLYYLPSFMKPIDRFFGLFPGLASDLIVMARKAG